jgi:hypothetical protein
MFPGSPPKSKMDRCFAEAAIAVTHNPGQQMATFDHPRLFRNIFAKQSKPIFIRRQRRAGRKMRD